MMVIKSMMGVMPQLDVAAMIGMMMGVPVAVGWIIHFMIGTIAWGSGFALLYDVIPGGSAIGKGIVFGVAAWLGMMVMIMPMAGAGFFGMNMGMMTLVLLPFICCFLAHPRRCTPLGAVASDLAQTEP